MKDKSSNNNLVSSVTGTVVSDTGGTTQESKKISITALKPPRKSTIKLCRMCGRTLIDAYTCPKCRFKN